MSIEDENTIDAIGLNEIRDEVVLLITDHLPWDPNTDEHLYKLQSKINAYISYCDSGQIYTKYPAYKSKKIVFEIAFKYDLNEKGCWFIEKVKSSLEPTGIGLRINVGD